jgi:hypothetical protein
MRLDHDAALGFAPHSGWAVVVGVGEIDGQPRVLVRDRIEMNDARDPASKQPYHAVEGLPIAEARNVLAVYEATAGRMAHEAVARIVDALATDGHRVGGVGILDSAGRRAGSLAATLASHALIHAADGDHFRTAIAAAAARCRLVTTRVRARDLEVEAAVAIGRAPRALHETLRRLGREVGPPWTADQKTATLVAWLVLTKARAGRTRP